MGKIPRTIFLAAPQSPSLRYFEYLFLDHDFDLQYQVEDRFMGVSTSFAIVAIAIACLGLYGLAMFTTETRFKEIGIRKVLGATPGNVIALLTYKPNR
jgi:putative ABC transport system permease protein